MQLHVEFATPTEVKGDGQGRGNSGVFLAGAFEIQVLDSFENKTYPDGQASAMYGQFPPLVNASRGPGQWQTYDIVFTAPRFNAGGTLEKPAVVTVFHNGVVVHNATAFWGPTAAQADREVRAGARERSAPPAGSREPGELPEHLDQAAQELRRVGRRRGSDSRRTTVPSPGSPAERC